MTDIDPDTITKVATPARRVIRTLIQLIAGLIVTVPLAAKAFDLSAEDAAQVAAVMLFLTGVLSAIQNAIEAKGGTDTPALGVKVTPPTHPVEG